MYLLSKFWLIRFYVNNFFIPKNLKGNLLLGKSDREIKTPKLDSTSIKQQGWKVKLKSVDFQNIAFRYDDMQTRKAVKGIDYIH